MLNPRSVDRYAQVLAIKEKDVVGDESQDLGIAILGQAFCLFSFLPVQEIFESLSLPCPTVPTEKNMS